VFPGWHLAHSDRNGPFGLVNVVMTENDTEEKFYTVCSSIRSVMSIAVSVLNSPSLNVVQNFIYRKPSSSLVINNVFTVMSEYMYALECVVICK